MTRTAPRTTLLRLVAAASLLLTAAFAAPVANAAPGDTVSIDVYDQCANDTGTGYGAGDTLCRWINGNLNPANSDWVEGDSVPERLALKNLVPGATYAVTFSYGTTKQGKHAYDFLTTFDASETWITAAERCEGLNNAAGCLASSDVTASIPTDASAGGYDAAFGTRNFTLRGATGASVTSGPTLNSGSYAGDSDTYITLSFTVASSGAWCTTTCNVGIWFGAHVAKESDWGVGTGAGSIPGSPFHVALVDIDGAAVGARDNQMSADFASPPAPVPGSLQLAANVSGGPVGYTGPFRLSYTCGAPANLSGFRDITAGQSVTITGISDGSTCSVTSTPPTAPTNYTWGTTTWVPVSQSVSISSGTTKSVTANFVLSQNVTPPPPVTPVAALTVTKVAGLSADGPWQSSVETEAGATVWYRITVTNSGDVALTGLSVADSMTDDATPPDCPALPASLAAGASWTCTYSLIPPDGASTNTVTADSDQTAASVAAAEVAMAEVLPATDVVSTPAPQVDKMARYAPLGLGLLFAALLVALAMGLPERRKR